MIRFFGASISRKILLSFIGIYAVTYLMTATVVFTSVRTSIIDTETHALSQLATSKAERLSEARRAGAVNLRAWASLDVMNDLISGDVDKRVDRTLDALRRQYSLNGDIFAFDTTGKLIASASDTEATATVKAPPLWQPKGAQAFFVGKHADPVDGKPIVALVQPVTGNFSPDFQVGFLVLTFPWQNIETQLFGNDAHTVLLANGIILASDLPRAVEPSALAGTAAMPTTVIDGESYVMGRASLPGDGQTWSVVTLRQTDEAVAAVRRVAWELALLGILLGIPVVVGIRWLATKLTTPVVELTNLVTAITGSDALHRRVPVSGEDELSVLAVSFNRMLEALEHTSAERERFVHELEALNQTLESKVAQRTQELTRAFEDLKSTQGQLVQSEKMASLGQLVAGVAHELNNPIAFIYANFPHLDEYVAELLALVEDLRALPADPDSRSRAEELVAKADLDYLKDDIFKIIRSGKDGAQRIREIVRSLRSFSRMDEGEFKPARLEDGIDDTLSILQHELKNRIEVERDYRLDTDIPCFPGQINQVFMNIIFNAVQAMEGKGKLSLSTRRDGSWAVVSIADTGPGIPPDVLKRIFDPFFTTKKVGEGTGLGLSISYGIVEKHKGRIEVSSEVGRGTTFEIRLPLRAETAGEVLETKND